MKICYLADTTNIHTQRWIKYFVNGENEIHLISLKPIDLNTIKNVEFHLIKRLRHQIRFISFPINLLSDIIQVKKIIKEIGPDVLHAHYVTNYGVIAALCGFNPFIISAWGSDLLITTKKSEILKIFVKFALKKADLITCSGEHLLEDVLNYNLNSKKVKLIHHGVDTKKFQNRTIKSDFKKYFPIFNFPTVISTRNLEKVYDVETLIKSIPYVIKKIPDVKFIIVGKGTQENDLKGLAKSLGVLEKIWFAGWVQHDELAKYLSGSDIYVSTSISDAGVAISTMEAMSCGLAPIVTDIADNSKWIKDGENGFIFSTKDSESLAEKIIYLLKNEHVRRQFGDKNRILIEEKVDYYNCMSEMEKIYKRLING